MTFWFELIHWSPWSGHKNLVVFQYILPATSFPFHWQHWQCFGSLVKFFSCLRRKLLKVISSLCEYRWTFGYPMNSLFLPAIFKDQALPLIPLDVSKTVCACYRLNQCCSLGPGSSAAGGTGAVPCFYLTFDTWILSWSAGGVKICIQLM